MLNTFFYYKNITEFDFSAKNNYKKMIKIILLLLVLKESNKPTNYFKPYMKHAHLSNKKYVSFHRWIGRHVVVLRC